MTELWQMGLPDEDRERQPILGQDPVDRAHLARQTLGDSNIEREVLALFVDQATLVADRIAATNSAERVHLAHALRGAAGGVGAFGIAKAAAAVESAPDNSALIADLTAQIAAAISFIASISR